MTTSNQALEPSDGVVLHALRDVATLTSIQEALQVMKSLDTVLPASDGVKWFNLLYLYVTEAIEEGPPAGGWEDQRWLDRLDVIFAGLYFDALARSYTDPASVPRAWAALFESRHQSDVQRVQFAVAGMNAHINHDLPLAVVETCTTLGIAPARGTPEYHDYDVVNGIIDTLEPKALEFLATGVAGTVAQDLNCVGRVLSNWSVMTARDTAWSNAEILWEVRDLPTARDSLLLALDRMTGFAGRGLLVPR